jgi:hypothetical protein
MFSSQLNFSQHYNHKKKKMRQDYLQTKNVQKK